MSAIEQLLEQKRSEVVLYRSDLFQESDDPEWSKKHPVGPVHIQINCKICGEVLCRDLKNYGWLENDSFWKTNLVPHLIEKHTQ